MNKISIFALLFFFPFALLSQEERLSKKEAKQEVLRLKILLEDLEKEKEELLINLNLRNILFEEKKKEFDELFYKNQTLELEISKLLGQDSTKSLELKISDIKNQIRTNKELIDLKEKKINHFLSKISSDSLNNILLNNVIDDKDQSIQNLRLDIDSLNMLIEKKDKRIKNLKDSVITSFKKKKKLLSSRSVKTAKLSLKPIELNIKEDWILLNTNSATNFIKLYNVKCSSSHDEDTIENVRLSTSYWPDSFQTEGVQFFIFKNLDDLDQERGELFSGICYAYSNGGAYLLREMIENGQKIDEKKIFKNFIKYKGTISNDNIFVYEVVNGKCIDFKIFELESSTCVNYTYNHSYPDSGTPSVEDLWSGNMLCYLKEHHVHNSEGLLLQLKKYNLFREYSNNDMRTWGTKNSKCALFYYLREEKNYKVKSSIFCNKNERLSSILHGVQKKWGIISPVFYDMKKYGYFLSEEKNYKNGKKHGLFFKWKFLSYRKDGDPEKIADVYLPPKLVYSGEYYNNVLVGTHTEWAYDKYAQRNRKKSDFIKNHGKTVYMDSVYYIQSKKKYFPVVDSWSGLRNLLIKEVFIGSGGYVEDYELDFYKGENAHDFGAENKIFNENGFHKTPFSEYLVRRILKSKKYYYDFDQKFIKAERIYAGVWNLDHPIKIIEYWKNGKMKAENNYERGTRKSVLYKNWYENGQLKYIIKDKKETCYNKKGERIQCQN